MNSFWDKNLYNFQSRPKINNYFMQFMIWIDFEIEDSLNITNLSILSILEIREIYHVIVIFLIIYLIIYIERKREREYKKKNIEKIFYFGKIFL